MDYLKDEARGQLDLREQSQLHPAKPCQQLGGIIHLQAHNRGASNIGQPLYRACFSVYLKMFLPIIMTRMEKTGFVLRHLINTNKIIRLVKIAGAAG